MNTPKDETSTRDIARLMKMNIGGRWAVLLDDMQVEDRLDVLDVAECVAEASQLRGAAIGINGALEFMRALGLLLVSERDAAAQDTVRLARTAGLL